MKIFKKILFVVLFIACAFATTLKTNADSSVYVIAGGDAIGLDLNTGVFVTGTFDSGNGSNIKKGDNIIKIDGITINNVEELKKAILNKKLGSKCVIEFYRNGLAMKTSITISEKDGKNTLGLYVKDNILGVGTLTYVVPETMNFASLGHSACNEFSKISGGRILKCYINGINKGIRGIPGEKKALLDTEEMGIVSINNNIGLFGVMDDFKYEKEDLVKVCDDKNVKLGNAKIRTVLDGYKIEEFDIEIIELKRQNENETKGIKFKVIDEDLIKKTGGIIQGMSGSPIIQNNELVGAVSHVVIDDPTTGYGVYAEWMLNFSKN